MTDVLTVGALGSILLTRWKLLVAFVVLGVGAGVAYGMLAPATYTSKAVLFVIANPVDKDGYYQAAQFAEKRAATYPALLSAPEVLERTVTELDLDLPASALIPMLTATNPTDSSLVEVTATAGTPELAQQLAGTAADYLAEYAIDLEDSSTKVGAVTITMAVPARAPQYPSSPSPQVLGALGGLAGGALGVAAAVTANATRRRPRSGDGRSRASRRGAADGPRDAGATGDPGHAGRSTPAAATRPADGSDDTDAAALWTPAVGAVTGTDAATGRIGGIGRIGRRRRAQSPAGPVRFEGTDRGGARNGDPAPASSGRRRSGDGNASGRRASPNGHPARSDDPPTTGEGQPVREASFDLGASGESAPWRGSVDRPGTSARGR